jgi:hypothetical protein
MYTRRSFIAQLATAATASALTAPFVRANPAASAPPARSNPVVGTGAYTYECVHDWLVPPDGMVWGDTQGLCQDSQGYIYVAHTVHASSKRPESIVVFDPDGKFVRAFGSDFRGGAHGLDVRTEAGTELLYHCDTVRSRVAKTDLKGDLLWTHGYPNEDPAYAGAPIKYVPTNVAFAPNGDFFIGDGYGSNRMLKFSAQGEFLAEIAQPGKADGQINNPHGQWVDLRGPEPVLVIADRGNRRIQTFSLDGKHLRTIKDDTRLRQPCNFDVRGDLMVCPDLDSQVCLLDRNYAVVAQLGDGLASNGSVGSRRKQTRAEFTPGQFICPHDAIFLKNGDILVAEWLPIGRLTLLRHVA